jgi:hypothetical protein
MNCPGFQRWLDEGMPASSGPAPRLHASACARCGADLAAAEAIEQGLVRAMHRAPEGLTDHIMARVAAIESQRAVPVPMAWRDAFPWWARAAGEPAAVAAMLLCGLLVWQWRAVARAGVELTAWLVRGEPAVMLPAQSFGTHVALLVILVPASMWLGRAMFRASGNWVERAAGRRI